MNQLKAQACNVLQVDESEYSIEFGNTTYAGHQSLDKCGDMDDVRISKNSE